MKAIERVQAQQGRKETDESRQEGIGRSEPRKATAGAPPPPLPPPPPSNTKKDGIPPPPPPLLGVRKTGWLSGNKGKHSNHAMNEVNDNREKKAYPYVENLDMNSGKYLTKELIGGWSPEGEDVMWNSMLKEELDKLQERIIIKGIKPMLSLFGIKPNISSGDVLLLKSREFGYSILGEQLIKEGKLKWDFDQLFSEKKPKTEEIHKELLLDKNNYSSDKDIDSCLSGYENTRGKAIGSCRLLNIEAKGINDLGLHLLVHEMIHTLASQKWKNNRKDVNDFSGEGGSDWLDESLTELFARIASQEMIKNGANEGLKTSPSVPEYKENIKATIDDPDTSESSAYELSIGGIYAQNIKKLIESKESSGSESKKIFGPEDLKKWAKKYFTEE